MKHVSCTIYKKIYNVTMNKYVYVRTHKYNCILIYSFNIFNAKNAFRRKVSLKIHVLSLNPENTKNLFKIC